MTTVHEVKERLEDKFGACQVQDNGNGVIQLRVEPVDAVANVWENGTCVVQGKAAGELGEVLGDLVGTRKGGFQKPAVAEPDRSVGVRPPNLNVFVVYGQDKRAKNDTESMLRRWGLNPVLLDAVPSAGNTLIEKLEEYQNLAGYAVVLLTPDDMGYKQMTPGDARPRARQNVVLEMGMLIGKLGRHRVAVLHKRGDVDLELPSDVNGIVYIPFRDEVRDAGSMLAKEMSKVGFYKVDVDHL